MLFPSHMVRTRIQQSNQRQSLSFDHIWLTRWTKIAPHVIFISNFPLPFISIVHHILLQIQILHIPLHPIIKVFFDLPLILSSLKFQPPTSLSNICYSNTSFCFMYPCPIFDARTLIWHSTLGHVPSDISTWV